jgi:hypothetical protein
MCYKLAARLLTRIGYKYRPIFYHYHYYHLTTMLAQVYFKVVLLLVALHCIAAQPTMTKEQAEAYCLGVYGKGATKELLLACRCIYHGGDDCE